MNDQAFVNIDPESVARWLEASGDFRVLRKIKPVESLGGEVNQAVRVLVFDTETTGLELATAELIEVGAILIEVDRDSGRIGRVLGTFGGLEQPAAPIPPDSTAIHGITDEMVRGKKFDEPALQDLCQGVALYLAHNASFDKPFLTRRFPWLESTVWACTVQELPWLQEGYSGKKLDYLLADSGFFHKAHRAVEDCNALVHLLSQPLKSSQQMPMAVLFESANESIYQIAALKAPFDKKDFLKARGFRWNSEDRVWEYEAFGFGEGKEVIEWLKKTVYGTNEKIMLGFRTRTGADRCSNSVIKQQFKEV